MTPLPESPRMPRGERNAVNKKWSRAPIAGLLVQLGKRTDSVSSQQHQRFEQVSVPREVLLEGEPSVLQLEATSRREQGVELGSPLSRTRLRVW